MKKIRDFIIHLVGGITMDELHGQQTNFHTLGEYMAYYKIKLFMEGMNGTQADEWCQKAYEHVSEQMGRLEELHKI